MLKNVKKSLNDKKFRNICDGRTDGRTDGPTDRPRCRVACTRLTTCQRDIIMTFWIHDSYFCPPIPGNSHRKKHAHIQFYRDVKSIMKHLSVTGEPEKRNDARSPEAEKKRKPFTRRSFLTWKYSINPCPITINVISNVYIEAMNRSEKGSPFHWKSSNHGLCLSWCAKA